MKKIRVAFPVCALMALTLCATPANALANEASDIAFAEEEVAFVEENTVPGKAQVAAVEENLEPEEEQSFEAVSQDTQVFAEDELEVEGENAMQEEGDAAAGAQGGDQGNVKIGAQGGDQGNVKIGAQGGDHNDTGSSTRDAVRSESQGNMEKSVANCSLKGKVRTHRMGEDLDLTGLYWLVTYDDGSTSTVDVNPIELFGYDPYQYGAQWVDCIQIIENFTRVGSFSVSVIRGGSVSLGSSGNVVEGIKVKPSTRPVAAKRIDPGSSANVDFSTASQILKKLEYQYSFNKGGAIKSTKNQLYVAGARVFDTAFVAKKKIDTSGDLPGNNLVERALEGGKPHSHLIKLGVGYRF